MPYKWRSYIRGIHRKLFLNPVTRGFFQPFSSPPKNKTYIFVVGCYNSGTTLLNEILGHHPEISMLDTEGVYLTPVLPVPEDFGWNRMFHKCHRQMEIAADEAPAVFRRVKRDWGYWHDRDKPFFIEKSVANALWIRWLDRFFEGAYFIRIARNGYAVSEGIRRRTKGKILQYAPTYEYPAQLCAQQWVYSNTLIEEELKPVKNTYSLTYEALTANPEQETARLLEWLPVKSKQMEVLSSFQFQGEASPVRNMNAESIARLSGADITAVNQVAGEMLARCGYDILEAAT